MNYILLQNPGHNRVYYNLADKLALAELSIASQRFSNPCINIKVVEIENVRYLSFETEKELCESDLQIVSRLSFLFALFRLEKLNGKVCFIPVRKVDYKYLDSKISSILKYQGKTNELFTKMMINVALLTSNFSYSDKICMLDPVAGRGTTLFEGTVYGFNVFGIEIEQKSIHETNIFFKKYLQTERIKHKTTNRQIYSAGKAQKNFIDEFEYALTKEELKSTETTKVLGLVGGNSKDAHKYFKNEKFHIIVGDLPYGVVHGNTGANKTGSVTRNPSELLHECLPEWHKVLLKGGVVVMAWNSFVASKQKLSEVFASHGFQVLSQAPYDEFEHMVDKSIKRDIVVAKKN